MGSGRHRALRVVPALGNAAVVATDRYVLSRVTRSEPKPLDSDIEHQLREYYRTDISLLESLCQVDLGRWSNSDRPLIDPG